MDNYKQNYHYLDNSYDNPKEIFKFIGGLIKDKLNGMSEFSLLDMGCAKGEFIYYLKKEFQHHETSFAGTDFSASLINKAKECPELEDVDFLCERAETVRWNQTFDFITATGVISFYDDYRDFLSNIFLHLNKNGTAFITNGFSISEYDVIVKFRRNGNWNERMDGWNQHSIEGIKRFAGKHGKKVTPHQFRLPFDLEKSNDPLRSWTLSTSEDQKFVNGLNQIWNLWTLEIQ